MDGILANIEKYLEKLHSIYLYPARYRWEIPYKIIEKLKNEGRKGLLFDPFAGSGTLAIEAYRNCYDSISWDINPMLKVLVEAKKLLISKNIIDFEKLRKKVFEALNYEGDFLPYDNLTEWYPKEILPYIRKLWAYYHQYIGYYDKSTNDIVFRDKNSPLFTIVSLDLTRKLSYTDDSIYKYYRSKYKRDKLEKILSTPERLNSYIKNLIDRKIKQFKNIYNNLPKAECNVSCETRILMDTVSNIKKAPSDILAVITSPPYLIAHEYIRSFKYDLIWLGVPLNIVKKISRLEIPYNDPPSISIVSPTYTRYKSLIKDEVRRRKIKTNLLEIYEKYFNSIIYVLDILAEKLTNNGYLVTFVGQATLAGIKIPIHKILVEHLESKGLRNSGNSICFIEDKIRNRRLFKRRKNRNPDGIKYEYLIVLKRP